MGSILLSILIPTLPERKGTLDTIVNRLKSEYKLFPGLVEIILDSRPARNKGGPTIAAKRNALYQKAKGLFSVQIDDDDLVHPDYLKEILKVLRVRGDEIDAIEHDIQVLPGNHVSRVSFQNKGWRHNLPGKYKYQQPIYYKVPIRTSICQQCKMDESKIWQEDAEFAQKIKRHIKKTHRIDKALYIYNMPTNVNIHDRY